MPNYLGQHFLKNTAIIKKIVAALDPQLGETIIEIGPGHGELTIPLATACKKIGAKIISVEKDKALADALRLKIQNSDIGSVEIINGDILEFLKGEGGSRLMHPPFKFVGNIPYYLTGHLLRIIGELEMKPTRAILMIQKEVAERICTEPPRMNRLAASVQFSAEPKIIARVPRQDFSPPPEVDSAVILLETKSRATKIGAAATDRYFAAVRTLFAQPRKTVLNNLASEKGSKISREKISEALERMKIDPKARPQNLTVEDISHIAEKLDFSGAVYN